MATTLSKGYILPNTGDKGSTWFPALEHNITQLNDHKHDGTTSFKIPTTNVEAVKQTLAGPWVVDVADTRWYQELTLPNDANYSDVVIVVKSAAGDQLLLDVKAGSTAKKYKVYTNDQGLTNAVAHILV
jgi:hypothetical protein